MTMSCRWDVAERMGMGYTTLGSILLNVSSRNWVFLVYLDTFEVSHPEYSALFPSRSSTTRVTGEPWGRLRDLGSHR